MTSLLLRKMSLHFLRTSCVCPITSSKSEVWWRSVWPFRLCLICHHRSLHSCPLFDTSHEWCAQPLVIQLTPLPSPDPHRFTRDQRAPQGEDPVSSGSLGVCFCLTETGDMRKKCLHLFIWCQPPPAFCPSHFHLCPVPGYRGHLVCVWTSSVNVCFLCVCVCVSYTVWRDRRDNRSKERPLPFPQAQLLLSL